MALNLSLHLILLILGVLFIWNTAYANTPSDIYFSYTKSVGINSVLLMLYCFHLYYIN